MNKKITIKKKCKHYNLKIYKNLKVFHVTEISINYDKDEDYHEVTIESDWTSEWDICDYADIEVFCQDCKKSWRCKRRENFPKWLQEVLDQEESHFEDL